MHISNVAMVALVSLLVTAPCRSESPDSEKIRDRAVLYTGKLHAALNDVSAAWSLDALRAHISPAGFDDQQAIYKSMLVRSQPLGRWKACSEPVFGVPEALDVDGANALTGPCTFENGTATVAMIFLQVESEPEVMGLIVLKPEISTKAGNR